MVFMVVASHVIVRFKICDSVISPIQGAGGVTRTDGRLNHCIVTGIITIDNGDTPPRITV